MKASEKNAEKTVLFLDLETVGQHHSLSNAGEVTYQFWQKKAAQIDRQAEFGPAVLYRKKAGIYAEFGKIVTIGVGFIRSNQHAEKQLIISDFSGDDEPEVLKKFIKFIENNFNQEHLYLCAHNGKEFDFPYLCRRMIINEIPIPKVLSLSGKKPWEIKHIDTMEMWKFGDRKQYTSLDLLAYILNIPSSKTEIDGSQVHDVYYEQKNLNKIATYCRKDVEVTARVFMKLGVNN